jgi:type II secretory pathway pseudopilin PulG
MVEIIIVVVILGILASVAIPRFTGFAERARAAEAMKYFDQVKSATLMCYNTKGNWEDCDTPGEWEFNVATTSTGLPATIDECTTALGHCDFVVTDCGGGLGWAMMRVHSDGTVTFSTNWPEFQSLLKGTVEVMIPNALPC